MAKIVLSFGTKVLREVPLAKERITIGRRPHNDIVLDDLAISGEHAVIVNLKHDPYLEDLNSTNGTQVNGQPVKKHYLRDGDCIELAQYRIRYISSGTQTDMAGFLHGGQRARVRILSGPRAGNESVLSKAITSVGKPDEHTAVILQQRDGYYLAHVEGVSSPLLNGSAVGDRPCKLNDGDVIQLDCDRLQFMLS